MGLGVLEHQRHASVTRPLHNEGLKKTSKILRTKTAGTSFNRHTRYDSGRAHPYHPNAPAYFRVPEPDEAKCAVQEKRTSPLWGIIMGLSALSVLLGAGYALIA